MTTFADSLFKPKPGELLAPADRVAAPLIPIGIGVAVLGVLVRNPVMPVAGAVTSLGAMVYLMTRLHALDQKAHESAGLT